MTPWSSGRPRPTVTFTFWRMVGSTWKKVTTKTVTANLSATATLSYSFRTTGRWAVTARANATTVVVASPVSPRVLYKVY